MTPTPSRRPFFFCALEPDPPFARRLLGWKEQARRRAGSQRYLDDPPHLTLYVAKARPRVAVGELLARVAANWTAPCISLAGWHVFQADPLTGGDTLVCDPTAAAMEALRDGQAAVIRALAPHRDARACQARYLSRWTALTAIQRQCVRDVGFPYVGAGWHPHFTVASFAPGLWPRLEDTFLGDPPSGEVRGVALRLYAITGGKPECLQTFPLPVG